MNRSIRVLAFIPTLGGGGAEKHVERLASASDRARATIDVAVVRSGGGFERSLDPQVRTIELRPAKLRSGTAEILACAPALLRQMASGEWDAIVAFLERPAIVALACHALLPARRRPALLLSVQADPSSIVASDPLGPVFERAMRHLYRRADDVIAISEGVSRSLRAYDPSLRPVVVPNACVDARLRAMLEPRPARSTSPTIVACGRLTEQKGFDVLLDAFAQVRRALPDAQLRILGTGPLEALLKAQRARLGLDASVTFVGFVPDPVREFAAADVFCLSSRFEGLGMVIVEAMAAGTPIVSTDCPSGPSEILEGGEHGVLVPPLDPRALADALIRVLGDEALRAELGRRGRARAEAYEASAVARRYVDAIEGAIARSRQSAS